MVRLAVPPVLNDIAPAFVRNEIAPKGIVSFIFALFELSSDMANELPEAPVSKN